MAEKVKWGGQASYFPKVGGDDLLFTITDITKFEGESELNFKTKDGGDQGYHFEIKADNANTYALGTYALLKEFARLDIQVGDTIKVQHPGKGHYVVEVLSRGKSSWDD